MSDSVESDSIPKNSSNGSIMKPFKVFVGYDPHDEMAYEVCCYSILKLSSIPVEIRPIKQSYLRQIRLIGVREENSRAPSSPAS